MSRVVRRLALIVVLALAAAGMSACSSGTFEVVAVFDDVGDLQSRHGVQVADVRVGAIKGIKLTDGFKARVRMRINHGVQVPRDSVALLRTTSLLGEKFIELRPKGDPAAGPFLRDGDVLSETGESPELEFVAQSTVDVLGAISAGDLSSMIRTGAEAFGGREGELRSLIDDLAVISNTFAQKTSTIQAVIDGLDRTSATLAQGSADIAKLFDNLATTTQVLADNRNRLITTLDKLSRLARVQNVTLDKYRTDIDRQIKQLSAISTVAANSTAQISSLVDWLDQFFTGLPKIIPGDFTQVYMWAIPCAQDHRAESCPPPSPDALPMP